MRDGTGEKHLLLSEAEKKRRFPINYLAKKINGGEGGLVVCNNWNLEPPLDQLIFLALAKLLSTVSPEVLIVLLLSLRSPEMRPSLLSWSTWYQNTRLCHPSTDPLKNTSEMTASYGGGGLPAPPPVARSAKSPTIRTRSLKSFSLINRHMFYLHGSRIASKCAKKTYFKTCFLCNV